MMKIKKAGRQDVSDGEKIKQMMEKCKYQLRKGEHQIFYTLATHKKNRKSRSRLPFSNPAERQKMRN